MNSRPGPGPGPGDATGQWPLDFTDHIGDLLRHAAFEYRLELGWSTTVHGDQLVLVLDEDLLALLMPATLAVELVAALRAQRLSCPVVSLPDPAQPRGIMLLEPDPRQPQAPLPACVTVLGAGQHIALPPTITPLGPVRWLTPLDPSCPRLPPVHLIAGELHRLLPPPAGDAHGGTRPATAAVPARRPARATHRPTAPVCQPALSETDERTISTTYRGGPAA